MDKEKNFTDKIIEMAKSEDPNFDEVMKNFNIKCPLKKINFSLDKPNAIAGMYLLSKLNSESIVKVKAEKFMQDLNDDTVLFFTNQQIVELADVVFGILYLLFSNSDQAGTKDAIKISIEYMEYCRALHTYEDYKDFCDEFMEGYDFISSDDNVVKVFNKIDTILHYLPFLAYNDLDEIANMAINDFKEHLDKVKNMYSKENKDERTDNTITEPDNQ